MTVALDARQRQLLRFIAGYQRAHGGVSPSLRECAVGLGAVAPSSAHAALVDLERTGAIRRLPDRVRAIEVLVPVTVPSVGQTPLYAVPRLPGAEARFDERRPS